jgi:hypothetical protein
MLILPEENHENLVSSEGDCVKSYLNKGYNDNPT